MRRVLGLTFACAWFCLSVAAADEVKPEVLASGLDNPWGLAVQPETGAVFVSESGAGRIVRVSEGKVEPIITGWPVESYGKGPSFKAGPLGIAFQDRETLVVGDSGLTAGAILRAFTIPAGPISPQDWDKAAKHKLGPLGEVAKRQGNFFGVALTKSAVFAPCNTSDLNVSIAKAEVTGSGFGKLEQYLAVQEAPNGSALTAIAVNPATGDLVLGLGDSFDTPADSSLSFYNTKTGKRLVNLPTGLKDLAGLAYSPRTGLLYATDFAGQDAAAGGLFRLDADLENGSLAVKSVKIISLPKATGLAFGKAGELYVGSFGERTPDGKSAGRILKLPPGL